MIGSNIKNIVFDMGRVLLDYDPALVARHAGASEEETALIKKYLFGSEEWILLDKGTITEEEAIRRIQDRLPNERLRKLAKECLDCWHEYNISPRPGMEKVVRDLKAKGTECTSAPTPPSASVYFRMRSQAFLLWRARWCRRKKSF